MPLKLSEARKRIQDQKREKKRREISHKHNLDFGLAPDWQRAQECSNVIGGSLQLTLSSISLVCDAERQILALPSISEVAGKPTMTTATFLFSISREKALQQSIKHL